MNITRHILIRFFTPAFFLFSAGSIPAATITWNNTSGGNWNVAGNWNPSQVPGAADTVAISTAGTYTVTINDTESAASLNVGGATGVQSLQVSSGGVLNGSAGTLAASGVLTVTGGGTLNVGRQLTVEGPLTNGGTINLTNAEIVIYNNNTTTYNGGIDNEGQINFYGSSGDQIESQLGEEYFINQGTVNEEAGTGISGVTAAEAGVIGGIYNAASGTTIEFGGGTATSPVTMNALPVLNGPGQYEFTSGYLLLTENVNTNLMLTGGTLELGPGFQQGGAITNLTLEGTSLVQGTNQVSGTLTMTNGTINGMLTINGGGVLDEYNMSLAASGSLTVASGGTVNVSRQLTVEGPMTNGGTINLTNAEIVIYNNNTTTYNGGIDNEGQINFYGSAGDQIESQLGDEYFINHGTVNEEAGAGIGTVTAADAGVIGGIYNAALGTTIEFGGGTATSPVTMNAPPVLNGLGEYEFVSGYLLLTENVNTNLMLTGGTLELGPGFQQGGAITNLTLEGTSLVQGTNQVNGTLTMTNGTIDGMLTINSGGILDEYNMTLAASGVLTVASGGTVNVSRQLTVEGPMTNGGTINLTNAEIVIYNNNTTTYNGGIDNEGQINFYGSSGDQIESQLGQEYFINQGTVNEEAGAGPSTIAASEGGVIEGIYNAASGTTIEFSGGTATSPVTMNAPPVLNGPGEYEFVSGYLLLAENVNSNLMLTGGTLELGPGFQQGGAITNLTLEGTSLMQGANQVNGTLTMTNGTINGMLTINSGGVLDEYNMTLAASGSLTVDGGGTVNVASRLTVEGPMTNGGTINLTNASIVIYNNNTTTYNGGMDNEGQINFYGIYGDQIETELGEEYLINQGTISQRPGTGGSTISAAVFTDPGTLDTQEGTLTLSTVSLQSSSVLNFGLNSLTDFGNINLGKSVVLSGTVSANLNNGFAPAIGNTFKVLSFPSFTGIFAQTNLPAGYLGEGMYSATSFSLLITGTGTPPSQPILTIERIGASTVTVSWPAAAGNFNLQTSPTLASGSWTDVTSGITTIGANFVLTTTVGGNTAFYRLQSL